METMEQLQATQQEPKIQLTDGQTESLTPLDLMPQQTTTSSVLGLSDSRFYTPDEFYEQFKSVFLFTGKTIGSESLPIKPEEEAGAKATSNRIYEMAQKYKFFNFLIDRKSTRLGETLLMIQFLMTKAGAVYYEKRNKKLGITLWQKIKRFGRQNRGKDTASLEQAEAEKQQKRAS